MKYEGDRPYSDPEKAGRWIMEQSILASFARRSTLSGSGTRFARFDFASQFEVCRFQISYAILNALL
ncbi:MULTISPECIES: hypothetical protein [Bradyrhizobium]|uniref:Uncharacterized protein n=1 Tax=Bradyrhizobium elkanii TaxID=29448 RepID=A0A4U6RZQ9_BRAEL|nr:MULTISPECIES: hypothetical protein [Bradyrhizobium]MTV19059.1 hypothetical protein [Bradyrhizobium sp. BR2003]TKV77876.1 hypothetical protein FDV58_28840 [Bradyrhizobium elkanii]